jgi:hypothetical protein
LQNWGRVAWEWYTERMTSSYDGMSRSKFYLSTR